MKRLRCVIFACCCAVVGVLFISQLLLEDNSETGHLEDEELVKVVVSSPLALKVGNFWVERLLKSVNVSLQQKESHLRRKREDVDEVGSCTDESCVEGVCSEDMTRCVCSDGFSGNYCQFNINECRSNPCQNEVRCIDGVNRYYCDCKEGWTGDDCSEDFDECSSMPCYGRGECLTPRIAMFVCRCRSGFYGINCEKDIEECWSHPCRNGGSCVDMVDRYFCICPIGFNGTNCEEDINECASSPCENGGICLDKVNEFQCQCLDGYLGIDCSDKVDKCADISCENGGECVAGINNAFCRCLKGFEGEFCDEETDECLQLPCQNSGSCIDLEAAYECICLDGFEGQNCEVDINECKSQPCQNNGHCNDDVNGYFCDCSNGFAGDQCEVDIDECASDPCRNGAECRDREGGFSCFCTNEFTGETCDIEISACFSNPCQNGGSCTDEPGRFLCDCTAGFVGERCEVETNECASTPCSNGGRCVDLVNSFICECAAGYKGDQCEVEEDECESSPCRNGGTCIDGHHSFRCVCTQFYEGTLCERKVKYCQPNTCLNGGKCVEDQIEKFICVCIDGFGGAICQKNIDECTDHSCENGGLCIDGVGSYTCLCRDGYQGKNCNDTTLADSRKLSQIMLSIIPAAGILILCLFTITLTLTCLRRQQTSMGDGHTIHHDAATSKNGETLNGKSSRDPNTDFKHDATKESGSVTNREKKPGNRKLSKDRRSKSRNVDEKENDRVSKRKKKTGLKDNGKDMKEKHDEMRRKRRKLENSKRGDVKHERRAKIQSKANKRNSLNNRPKTKRISIDHTQSPLENGSLPDKMNAGPKPGQTIVQMMNNKEDTPTRGEASAVIKQPLASNEKSKKVSSEMEKPSYNVGNGLMKNDSKQFRQPDVSTVIGNDYLPHGTTGGPTMIKQAILSPKGVNGKNSEIRSVPRRQQVLTKEMKEPLKNYESLPKQGNVRRNNGDVDRVPKSSAESSPIYIPIKTADGIPLYLPLGRLDQCCPNEPTITTSMPDNNTFTKRSSGGSPVVIERQLETRKPATDSNLSSPWQPVWKYNFPHLLMEDTQLERQFSYPDQRKQERTTRSRSTLENRHLTKPSHLARDHNIEAAENGSFKGRAELQKTFLKEEVGLLVKT